MSEIVVGIADMKCSNNLDDILITYALGSCIGIAIYDPSVKVGGLLHYMLPDSNLDKEKAEAKELWKQINSLQSKTGDRGPETGDRGHKTGD